MDLDELPPVKRVRRYEALLADLAEGKWRLVHTYGNGETSSSMLPYFRVHYPEFEWAKRGRDVYAKRKGGQDA